MGIFLLFALQHVLACFIRLHAADCRRSQLTSYFPLRTTASRGRMASCTHQSLDHQRAFKLEAMPSHKDSKA
ncbi:uncharacterized protein LY79DRAFT_565379 [Colletotrichum navitas]|uniref:Uncharacterized protein n=1 Tax=Colletotrichum navitas TaxID=681940 RepID=A0AAD8PRX3_9PEZI|nr:uncharacterized protein LY79DRAFT_565379 [Colletotrichum navitas]KAK1574655.1 hypothetical protein LY79DRAFT_565379 [Colletotrichum navitas]